MTSLHGKRILVVEDEPIVAMAVEDILLELGCEVVGPAYSLDEALVRIAAGLFDAAVLDINLNGERSYPAATALASMSIPFAFATGYAPDRVEPALAMAPVLEKPYNSVQIEALLYRIFGASPSRCDI
jgi:CheY-like chemotaxis protein